MYTNSLARVRRAQGDVSGLTLTTCPRGCRDASTEANKKIEAIGIESNMREDVYQSLLKYKAKGEQLGPVDQRRTASLPMSLCCGPWLLSD